MRRTLPFRILGGVFLLGLAVFAGVSLSGATPADPQPIPQYPTMDRAGNPCGIIGSYTAAYLLYMHGLGAFLIPLFLAAAGVYTIRSRDGFWRALGRIAGAFVVLASSSFLMGLVAGGGLPGPLAWLNPLGPGGVWGLVPVKMVLPYLGIVGAVFCGLLVLLSGFFLLSPTGTAWGMAATGAAVISLIRGGWRGLVFASSLLMSMSSGMVRRGPAMAAADAGTGHSSTAFPVVADDADENGVSPPEENAEEIGEENGDFSEDAGDSDSVEFVPRKPRRKRRSPRRNGGGGPHRTPRPPVVEYRLPPLSLLESERHQEGDSEDLLEERGTVIVETLKQYGVPARLQAYHMGPAVTLFEVQLEEGIRLSKVEGLSGDLAMRLRAPTQRLRIMAPIPGRGTVGIEVPNQKDRVVNLKPLLETPEFRLIRDKCSLPLVFGKDLLARPVTTDLASLPHLLIAGTTGSGKSVCINALIISLIMQKTPEELRFILIDPKQVEMSHYTRLPHLLTPVVTDIKRSVKVLEWATMEMEKRYTLFHRTNVRNLTEYNRVPYEQRLSRAGIQDFESEEADEIPEKMQYVIIVVDEFADLIMQSRKDVETYVQRLAQKARAAGLHLVFATQRPSADVFKGVIKANFPAVAAFHVSSAVNSRVVLDELGAEALLGKGDMLFRSPEVRKPIRAKGAYLDDEEIHRVVQFWANQASPDFSEEVEAVMMQEDEEEQGPDSSLPLGAQDDRFDEAVQYIIGTGRASASSLQAGMGIGYARANKLITAMEELNIVGEQRGVKFREILLNSAEWEEKKQEIYGRGPYGGKTLFAEESDETAGDEAAAADPPEEDEIEEKETAQEHDQPAGCSDDDTEDEADLDEDLDDDKEDETEDEEDEPSASDKESEEGGESAASFSAGGAITRMDHDTTQFDFPSIPGE